MACLKVLGHVVLFACLLIAGSAWAQLSLPGLPTPQAEQSAAPLAPLSPDAANALLSQLSDREVRALLLQQLNAQSPANAIPAAGVSDFVYHATTGALNNILVTLQRLPVLVERQTGAFASFFGGIGAVGIATLFSYLALTLALAYAIELAFRRLVAKWAILPTTHPEHMNLGHTLGLLSRRLISDLGAVLVFLAAARLIGMLLLPAQYLPVALLIEIYLIAIPRLAKAFARFLMAPHNPAYRVVRATDADAGRVVFHTFWFAFLVGLSIALLDFNELNGIMRGELRLGFWFNFFIHLYIAVILWRNRRAVADMMRGYDPDISSFEERIARAFPYFGIAMSVLIWWMVNIVGSYGNFQLLASTPHYKTLFLALLAPALDTAIRGIVRHTAAPMTGEGAVAERAHLAARQSFIRIGRVIVFGLALILIARFWGMTPTTIASAGVGPRLAASMIRFMIILSIGYLIYELVGFYINRKLAAEYTASGYNPEAQEIGGDGGGAGGSRLSTVLPLVLLVSRSAIVVLFVLLALSNVGVDTTPLLAGAGIVGLAIGFGAQKLVTDVVSGIFFLVDDAFRTGEYVEVEGTMGTVEKISIRSLQLRHHRGPVHTIPYGEIPKITNYSRDWVIMKLRFTVPFGTDPNKVKKIFKQIGQDLLEMPDIGPDFIQPFKSQGVLEIDDVGIVIRGKFMCRPGGQFMIRKEIFNRVNAAFEAAGIEFARREVRVALPGRDNTDLTEKDRQAITAAASQAVEAQFPPEGGNEQH